jgi:hypothetical protein
MHQKIIENLTIKFQKEKVRCLKIQEWFNRMTYQLRVVKIGFCTDIKIVFKSGDNVSS